MASPTPAQARRPTGRSVHPADHDKDPVASDGAPGPDRTKRQAALLATAVAVPLTVVVAVLAFVMLRPDDNGATPSATAAASATATPGARSTAPVPVDAPSLAARPATVCRALVSQLPDKVRDRAQRPVQAGAEQNAAYGDPPITVACGVPAPTYPPTDGLWVVDGVCWHGVSGPDGWVLSTVDREVPVQITVPASDPQPMQWAMPLASSIIDSVPSVKTLPAGCTG